MMFSLSLSLALANRLMKKKDHDNPDQKERGDSCRDPHGKLRKNIRHRRGSRRTFRHDRTCYMHRGCGVEGIHGRISDICLQGCLRGWAWAGAGALLTEGLTLPEMRDALRDLTRVGAGADPAMPLLSCLVVSSAATRKVVGARAFKGPLPPSLSL